MLWRSISWRLNWSSSSLVLGRQWSGWPKGPERIVDWSVDEGRRTDEPDKRRSECISWEFFGHKIKRFVAKGNNGAFERLSGISLMCITLSSLCFCLMNWFVVCGDQPNICWCLAFVMTSLFTDNTTLRPTVDGGEDDDVTPTPSPRVLALPGVSGCQAEALVHSTDYQTNSKTAAGSTIVLPSSQLMSITNNLHRHLLRLLVRLYSNCSQSTLWQVHSMERVLTDPAPWIHLSCGPYVWSVCCRNCSVESGGGLWKFFCSCKLLLIGRLQTVK